MQAIDILAHRGNIDGPHRERENTVQACAGALAAGFGLEIDVRHGQTGCYVSHDMAMPVAGNSLARFVPLFRAHPDRPVAVNVKELDNVPALACLVRAGTFGRRAFLFDFELLEPEAPGRTQRLIRTDPSLAAVTLAARMSDREEPSSQALQIPAQIVWADEFDGPWLTQAHIETIRKAERRVIVVSPDLHGFDRASMVRRWADFKRWQVDGICTDYAEEARDFFG